MAEESAAFPCWLCRNDAGSHKPRTVHCFSEVCARWNALISFRIWLVARFPVPWNGISIGVRPDPFPLLRVKGSAAEGAGWRDYMDRGFSCHVHLYRTRRRSMYSRVGWRTWSFSVRRTLFKGFAFVIISQSVHIGSHTSNLLLVTH